MLVDKRDRQREIRKKKGGNQINVSLIKPKGIKLSQTIALRGLVECWLSGAMELVPKKDLKANFLCAMILR